MSERKLKFTFPSCKTILKSLVSAFLIALVYRKMDVEVIQNLGFGTMFFLLISGTVLYALSKYFSASRQYHLIRNEGYSISFAMNIRLYWIGMYYNVLLPGGIGGDAVKVYRLRHHVQMPVRKGVRILVLDRMSGLITLFQLVCLLAFVLEVPIWSRTGIEWLLGLSLSWFGFYFAYRILSKRNMFQMWQGWFTSLMVQLIQISLAAIMILMLNKSAENIFPYLLAFMISSMAASLPVSIGGIGVREYCFLLLCTFFNLSVDVGIITAVLFFLCSLFASIPGAFMKLDGKTGPDKDAHTNQVVLS